jgi:hypothetical protein
VLAAEICSMISGKVMEVILRHDASRVVQVSSARKFYLMLSRLVWYVGRAQVRHAGAARGGMQGDVRPRAGADQGQARPLHRVQDAAVGLTRRASAGASYCDATPPHVCRVSTCSLAH